MRIKKTIKTVLSFVWHPFSMISLYLRGSRCLYFGPQMTINDINCLSMGRDVSLGRNSRFVFVKQYHGGQYKPSALIGSHISIGNRFTLLSAAPIIIQDNCLIASDVLITSENHGMNLEDADSYADLPLEAAPVTIGKGCWIGEKVSILPGVSLGNRCIVAANAVVTRSFPDACLIGGIPAKIIKKYNFVSHQWEHASEV